VVPLGSEAAFVTVAVYPAVLAVTVDGMAIAGVAGAATMVAIPEPGVPGCLTSLLMVQPMVTVLPLDGAVKLTLLVAVVLFAKLPLPLMVQAKL
jgi:hypothetical protein